MARIDILMPLFDRADTVAEAWDSLAAQTLSDFRLVAVDDGSTDGTAEVLRKAAGADSRVHIDRMEHAGIVAALNRGLCMVDAPLVVRMDGDDRCHPQRFEKLAALLALEGTGVAGSRLRAFPEETITANMARYLAWQNALLEPDEIRRERYVESTLAHGTAAFRTRVLVDAGGWCAEDGPEDLDLWLRLHGAGVVFRKSPEILYDWRLRHGSETRAGRCSADAFHRCRLAHLVGELRRREISATLVVGTGASLKRWTNDLRAAGIDADPVPWKPGRPLEWPNGRFVIACFGVPHVRARARRQLERLGREEDVFLFVG